MFLKSIKWTFYLTAMLVILSCGKKSEEKISDAVLDAQIFLSTSQCQAAIDVLESVGMQNRNAEYLKTLSAAYACRAGYSTTVFFGTDISKSASPAPLGGMTTYSTSQTTVTGTLSSDSKFKDLQTAIDTLLYAGGISKTTEPTSVERAKYFSGEDAAEINAQLAYMLLVQTGKLMKHYSNASSAGVKGAGSASNTCFTEYSTAHALAQALITSGVATGACTTVNAPHTELAIGATDRQKRLCQGVVLLNNIFDVLPSILISAGGGDLDSISKVTELIQAQKTILLGFDTTFTPTATVLSQTNCETDSNITLLSLTTYYAAFFETLMQ